jgi:hypothetical protein
MTNWNGSHHPPSNSTKSTGASEARKSLGNRCIDGLYRPQILRRRVEACAASAADGSRFCRTAFGV